MGTGKWPYLDVVWAAFETGSLLAVVGGGGQSVASEERHLQPSKQLG